MVPFGCLFGTLFGTLWGPFWGSHHAQWLPPEIWRGAGRGDRVRGDCIPRLATRPTPFQKYAKTTKKATPRASLRKVNCPGTLLGRQRNAPQGGQAPSAPAQNLASIVWGGPRVPVGIRGPPPFFFGVCGARFARGLEKKRQEAGARLSPTLTQGRNAAARHM